MEKPDEGPGATRIGGSGRLLVRFATTRDVLNADGNFLGRTNQPIGLSAGQHTVTLGAPQNYAPASQVVEIVANQLATVTFDREGV